VTMLFRYSNGKKELKEMHHPFGLRPHLGQGDSERRRRTGSRLSPALTKYGGKGLGPGGAGMMESIECVLLLPPSDSNPAP
jgi:hypothetical protein